MTPESEVRWRPVVALRASPKIATANEKKSGRHLIVIGSPRGIVPAPLFGKLPTQIRHVFADGPGQFWCVRAEILLKHSVIGGDNKRHHA
jgi:hypothetical protein